MNGLMYGGASICNFKKHFNLQSVKLNTFLLFSSIKLVFWHILRRAGCEICLKLKIKTPEYIKLTIKLTIKTPLTSTYSTSCYSVSAGVVACCSDALVLLESI